MPEDHARETEPGSFVDETLDEHAGCMLRVTELEACLDRRPDDAGRWIADLKDKLSSLDTAMRQHFESEESGPIFRSLPARHPRLADGLLALEAEHKVMLYYGNGRV